MDIRPVGPGEFIGEYPWPTEYRVRVWTRPGDDRFSWMVDEWDVREAPSVSAVIDWANSEWAGRPIEVFVKWSDRAVSSNGELEIVPRMTRVFGAPGDNELTTETIYFHRE